MNLQEPFGAQGWSVFSLFLNLLDVTIRAGRMAVVWSRESSAAHLEPVAPPQLASNGPEKSREKLIY